MKYIKTTIKEYLFEDLKFRVDKTHSEYSFDTIYYMNENSQEIGYIEYLYTGSNISEEVYGKEFYISMIKVYKEFRGNDYSSEMIEHIKKYAKEKGANIITLKVDTGLGFTERNPNNGLEKLYLKNGFDYMFSEEELEEDDTRNPGAMEYHL